MGIVRASELPPLPEAPGVYLWKQGEKVLYVGKAKNLKARVRSYFHAEGKAARIAQEATALEFIATRDEVEALLLEANLIKAHRPPYNVLLKDDKHYPFLKLTREPFPTLLVVRRVEEDGAKYYGPFPEASALRRIKTLIDRLFPLRKNSGYPMKKRRYPCLNYSMGRCLAPCVGLADPKAYQEVVRQVEAVLEGKVDGLLRELEAKMREAAQRLEFERAAEIRDQMEALRAFFSTAQQAFDPEMGDLDFLGLAQAGPLAVVQLYQVRSGRILGRISRVVEKEEASPEEILWAFLRDYYLEASPLPPLILLPFPLEDLEGLVALLHRRAGRRVELRVPKKGEKVRLLELAEKNARLALETELKQRERRGDHPALKALQEILGLSQRPYRLEGYDVSHLQGEARVFSMAVLEGGRPKRAEYRRMRLKAGNDDYAAMEEGVYRRFTGSLKDLPLPDLLLIDGGLGQVRAAARALERAGLSLPLVGLAKKEEVLITQEGREIRLPLTHPALQLLIHLRDEAHQNGLRYHQKRRSQELFQVLKGIPGIGEARRRLLLERYGGLKALKEAPLEELARLPGMNRKAAEALKAALEGALG
ncbi:excinuclease ABC subunit UvrC [Thermus antranikianii]|uniref:excinuclease ABC subunit UvrC n=1 Tax=Thermus antranikianii TaxID=88190 RepID=UPI000425F38E|nr:excinuclease ABC subunit UvrC [Thermus antranikianii]QWK22072.1 MAG: excinuclease ABC subunit UvrC [Thermus antranikianii]